MMIHSPIVAALWFVGAGFVADWLRRRVRDANAALEGYEGSKPSQDEADALRVARIIDGFIAGIAVLVLFALLAWLESLFALWGQ